MDTKNTNEDDYWHIGARIGLAVIIMGIALWLMNLIGW